MIAALIQSPFAEIAVLLVLAAVVGFIGVMLRQPLIVSFIAVGLLAGPSALDIVRADAQIDFLSELGIAVLLFLVGIKLDVKLIRSLGAVSLMTGLGQVAFTSVFGFLIGLALGLDAITTAFTSQWRSRFRRPSSSSSCFPTSARSTACTDRSHWVF